VLNRTRNLIKSRMLTKTGAIWLRYDYLELYRAACDDQLVMHVVMLLLAPPSRRLPSISYCIPVVCLSSICSSSVPASSSYNDQLSLTNRRNALHHSERTANK